MQYFPAKEDAIARMDRRKAEKVRWTYPDRVIEYKRIEARYARNWDGSSAGCDTDPNRKILQMMVWRDGSTPRYTNWW